MARTGTPAVWGLAAGGFGGMFGMVAVLLTMGFSSLAWIGFALRALAANVDFLSTWAMSDKKLAIRPAYSRAEAAEAQGEFEAALDEYRKLAKEHAADPEPHRRLAECLLAAHRPREAAQAMGEALRRQADPGEKLLLGLRLAEILAGDLRNHAAATALLEDLLRRFPKARGSAFVEARIRALRSR